jgi:flagellar hook-associated protein 3 FlgL
MAILPLQLARVSNLLRTSVATQSIAQTQAQLLDVQNQLSTGKRLNAPSDDPGDAAVAAQLRKVLEQRQAYADNLQAAGSQLGEVDSTLGDLGDLLKQAQTIASANVGSDVSAEARLSASAVVQSLFSQAVSIGNKQFEGVYLYAGDRSTEPPFVTDGAGVRFVGSSTLLGNQYDEHTALPFMVDGSEVFGALSTRVQGTADLTPALAANSRLGDLRGTSGAGVRLGSIQIGNGATSTTIDLSGADTVGDVIARINAAAVGGVTASIAPGGAGIQLTAGGGDNITVNEVGGGTTAADLGILTTVGGGAGVNVVGQSVQPSITGLTPLGALNGGAGIDLSNGIVVTNGSKTATINFSGATTVEDLLNKINGSDTGVRAEINAAGTGINILNPTQGSALTIAENGGTTAADLGVRSFAPDSKLSELNGGKGVRTVSGDDVTITASNGAQFGVDLDGATTVQDVLDKINAAATTAGVTVSASFTGTGNGVQLSDTSGGTGTFRIDSANYSNAMADLGLNVNASGNTITGKDVNPVNATGLFANLMKLRDALKANDQAGITAAAEGLQGDSQRVTRIRGETGARVQELESRQNRLADENLSTQSLLSQVEDTDYTSAIAKFQTLQTALQANLQTAGKTLNLSLLDFLG